MAQTELTINMNWGFDSLEPVTVPSAKTVDFPLLHSLANISVMQ